MVAFSNASGGLIIVGVKDNGEISGLSADDVRRLNNMISNVASDHVKPPITPLTKTVNGHPFSGGNRQLFWREISAGNMIPEGAPHIIIFSMV